MKNNKSYENLLKESKIDINQNEMSVNIMRL